MLCYVQVLAQQFLFRRNSGPTYCIQNIYLVDRIFVTYQYASFLRQVCLVFCILLCIPIHMKAAGSASSNSNNTLLLYHVTQHTCDVSPSGETKQEYFRLCFNEICANVTIYSDDFSSYSPTKTSIYIVRRSVCIDSGIGVVQNDQGGIRFQQLPKNADIRLEELSV